MTDPVAHLLADALARHQGRDPEGTYDEVLRTVAQRAAEEQSLSKADIGSLVLWKRITAQTKWATKLGTTPDEEVRKATGAAWAAANDASRSIPEAGQAAREALFGVPGLGGTAALASAVLLACAPTRMAVWDRRVRTALVALGVALPPRHGFYGAYLQILLGLAARMVEQQRDQAPVTPRDVDLALYEVAGAQDLLGRARLVGSRTSASL